MIILCAVLGYPRGPSDGQGGDRRGVHKSAFEISVFPRFATKPEPRFVSWLSGSASSILHSTNKNENQINFLIYFTMTSDTQPLCPIFVVHPAAKETGGGSQSARRCRTQRWWGRPSGSWGGTGPSEAPSPTARSSPPHPLTPAGGARGDVRRRGKAKKNIERLCIPNFALFLNFYLILNSFFVSSWFHIRTGN